MKVCQQSVRKSSLVKKLLLSVLISSIGYSSAWAAEVNNIVLSGGASQVYDEDVSITGSNSSGQAIELNNANSSIVKNSLQINGNLLINPDNKASTLTGIYLDKDSTMLINGAQTVINASEGGIEIGDNSTVDINSENTIININSNAKNSYGIYGEGIASSLNVNNLSINMYTSDAGLSTRGIAGHVTINGDLNMAMDISSATTFGRLHVFDGGGLNIAGPQINLNGRTNNIIVRAEGVDEVMISNLTPINIADNSVTNIKFDYMASANKVANVITGISGGLNLGKGATLNIDMSAQGSISANKLNHEDGAYAAISVRGHINASTMPQYLLEAGSTTNIRISAHDMKADTRGGWGGAIGINGYADLKADGDVNIHVTSPQGAGIRVEDARPKEYQPPNFFGQFEFNGDTVVTTNKGYALLSTSVLRVQPSNRADNIANAPSDKANTNNTSKVTINKNGGSLVQLTGELAHLTSHAKSHFVINMDRADSFLTGSSIMSSGRGTTDITLANGATWNMTGISELNTFGMSEVNQLTFANQGYLNMAASDTASAHTYERLYVNELGGDDGTILMNTDLQGSYDSKNIFANEKGMATDLIIINKKNYNQEDNQLSQGTHTINVKDTSLLSRNPAEGYVALVLDFTEGDAQFVGGKLLKGGIFKYKPIITNEDPDPNEYQGAETEANSWYLTGFEKLDDLQEGVFVDAGLAESRYISYMNEQDTLIKRLGELRQHDKEKGIWVRIRGANNSVDGYGVNRSSYVSTHLGYDWKLQEKDGSKAKRYMGVAFNHTNNNFDFAASATGKGQSNVVTVYGTRLGDKGHYLDLVGKLGRMSNNYKHQGQQVDASNWFYSLSAEYGRSIAKGKGWYYEPQMQFTFGHINGSSYRSAETHVSADSINSAILRAGILAGRKFNEDNQEKLGSYYAKLFYSHEFGGRVQATMRDIYGDSLRFSQSYSGGWLTVGLGTSLNLNKKTNLYLDVEKAFGGKVSGGWAWQGGVRWRF